VESDGAQALALGHEMVLSKLGKWGEGFKVRRVAVLPLVSTTRRTGLIGVRLRGREVCWAVLRTGGGLLQLCVLEQAEGETVGFRIGTVHGARSLRGDLGAVGVFDAET